MKSSSTTRNKQTPPRRDIIHRYAEIARPIMLKYMKPQSCIAATRVTIECLKAEGIEAIPVPVKFVVRADALQKVYVSGLTAAERATARECVQLGEDGWNGHLTVFTGPRGRRFFIDPSFDQALTGLGLSDAIASHVMPVMPIPRHIRPDILKLEYRGLLTDGNEIRVCYIALDNQKYKASEAWNDEGLPFIVEEILAHMRRER